MRKLILLFVAAISLSSCSSSDDSLLIVDLTVDSLSGTWKMTHAYVSPGGETTWQTVYQGLRPRLYRVACLPGGRLDVTVDGAQVERLCPGQSIDIEGMAIRVTTPDEEAAGVYGPVSYGRGEE